MPNVVPWPVPKFHIIRLNCPVVVPCRFHVSDYLLVKVEIKMTRGRKETHVRDNKKKKRRQKRIPFVPCQLLRVLSYISRDLKMH